MTRSRNFFWDSIPPRGTQILDELRDRLAEAECRLYVDGRIGLQDLEHRLERALTHQLPPPPPRAVTL